MKKILVLFILFTSNFLLSQNQIIVGPQNDCALKNIKKNVHTSSKWFDVTGVTKLKITTFQHRTYDKSSIYNENGVLIWEWNGESYSDTWYRKEHFLDINNAKKIKIEFTQGYSDPFCNGFVQVEKFSFDTNNKGGKSTKIDTKSQKSVNKSSKSDKSKTTSSSVKSNRKSSCQWCGKRFTGLGYSINDINGKIISGKFSDPLMVEVLFGKGKVDNTGDYCSRKCANDASYAK
jgi:hypothetical protein